jgi:MFS family permease
VFNAVSFQIMMGAPIIVFAKSLGASSTALGIIAAFTPLMTVFQLPAAQHLERHGYRRFVLMGWGTRTVLIFVVTAIPLAGFLDNTSKLAALLVVLFFFNLLRGISSAAWLPWITQLIPEHVRGRFLSIDQFFIRRVLGVAASLRAGHGRKGRTLGVCARVSHQRTGGHCKLGIHQADS